jgi:hypothetical protein
MGLFGGGNKKSDSDKSETLAKARQRKQTAEIDQEIAELQIRKAQIQGGKDSGGDFWATWWNEDWDM